MIIKSTAKKEARKSNFQLTFDIELLIEISHKGETFSRKSGNQFCFSYVIIVIGSLKKFVR